MSASSDGPEKALRQLVGLQALEPVPDGAAVTIGTFDGIHMGHRALISRTVERARDLGGKAVAVTWDRHPMETLRPDRVPPLLSSPLRKMELLQQTELDAVAVLAFDKELSSWPPERFVSDILVSGRPSASRGGRSGRPERTSTR